MAFGRSEAPDKHSLRLDLDFQSTKRFGAQPGGWLLLSSGKMIETFGVDGS